MTRYLISFPSRAMDDIPEEEMPAVGEAVRGRLPLCARGPRVRVRPARLSEHARPCQARLARAGSTGTARSSAKAADGGP